MMIDKQFVKKKLRLKGFIMPVFIGICTFVVFHFLFHDAGEESRKERTEPLKVDRKISDFKEKEIVEKSEEIIKNIRPVTIGESFNINSGILGRERKITIYLPDDYHTSVAKYHVLYILDGQWHFNYTSGIVHFLSGIGNIPQMLVVSVTNEGENNRGMDFLPASTQNGSRSGNARLFLSFLKKELIPYIETNYRTYPYRVLAGHSFGGLFTVYSLLTDPGVFDAYIAISPSLWWNDGLLTARAKTFFSKHTKLNKILVMTLCGEGKLMHSSLKKFERITKKNLPGGFRLYIRYMDDDDKDDHRTTNIRSRALALRWIYKNWQLPEQVIEKGLMSMKTHIIKLSEELGYNIVISEYLANKIGYGFIAAKEYKKAVNMFRYNSQLYPGSANVYDSLGEAYMLDSRYDLSRENYTRVLQLDPGNKQAEEMLRKLDLKLKKK
jgi:predicted alpha/beta superfamily hydrolase